MHFSRLEYLAGGKTNLYCHTKNTAQLRRQNMAQVQHEKVYGASMLRRRTRDFVRLCFGHIVQTMISVAHQIIQPLKMQTITETITAPSQTVLSVTEEGSSYWWRTSGLDLSRMLEEANYPEEVQRQFLDYYRDNICPLLGDKPKRNSKPAAVGWDGNPFEYSFEFKGSTQKAGVRFVVDLSELRPSNKENPLSIMNSEKVLDTLVKQSPMFDDAWVRHASWMSRFDFILFCLSSLTFSSQNMYTCLFG